MFGLVSVLVLALVLHSARGRGSGSGVFGGGGGGLGRAGGLGGVGDVGGGGGGWSGSRSHCYDQEGSRQSARSFSILFLILSDPKALNPRLHKPKRKPKD